MNADTVISVENLASGLSELSLYEQKPEGTTARRGKCYSLRNGSCLKLKNGPSYTVYAIEDGSGRIYIGQTEDLRVRIRSHNSGYVPSTRRDRPWRLIALEVLPSRSAARWLELQLKRSRGKRLRWIAVHRTEQR